MSKASFHSRAAWKIAYTAFSALVILLAVVIFARLQASAAAPAVTFERTDDTVAVNVTPAGSDELKFLRDSNAAQYWDWGTVDDKDDCDATGFVASEKALRDGSNNAVSLEVVTVTNDAHLCVNVLYGRSNSQTFRSSYAYYLFDVTAPMIETGQNGLSLTASSDDPSGIKVWHYYIGADDPINCSDNTDPAAFPSAPSASGNDYHTLTLTASQNDYYYCFRAEDTQGNAGYSAIAMVDTVAPHLSVDQPEESSMVTLSISQDDDDDANTLETNEDVDVDSWQYVQTSQTCTSASGWRDLDALTNDTSQSEAVISFSRSHVGRTYCFRVADEAGNHAYVQHTVGAINEPPVISRPRQSRQNVTATATDLQYLNDSSWQYTVTEDASCHSGLSGWRGLSSAGFSSDAASNRATLDISQADIDESSRDKWLCFRVSDNIADNYGYRSLNVDADEPTINLSQNNTTLRATAPSSDGAVSSSWSYVRYTSDFDCDADAFELYTPVRRGSSATLNRNDINDYFCFRAADRHDNYGYSTTYQVDSLDTVAPKLKVDQDNKYLKVAGASGEVIDDDTWGYAAGYATQQTCKDINDSYYEEVEDRTIELRESDVGDWFCIRAADASGNYGHYSVRIKAVDASAPDVLVERQVNILEASTEDGDVDENSWQYAVITDRVDRFDCQDGDASSLSFNSASADNDRVVLTDDDNDKYYCFRVADKSGNHGYGLSEQLDGIVPAPEITVYQLTDEKRLRVSTDASDVDGLTWGWAVSSSDPGDCTSVSYDDISNSQTTRTTSRIYVDDIADSQNGKYYCFRVADTSSDDRNPNYGYAKHRYDLTPPTIRFEFANNILTAVSDDTDVDSQTWHYANYKTLVDCEAVAINKPLPHRKLRLEKADNGTYFCFRVDDRVGNTGYARRSISGIGEKPVAPEIDFSHTKYAIIATSADNIDPLTWRYALAPSEPFCGTGHRLTFTENSGSLNKVDLTKVRRVYNWVCFQVESRDGVEGFAKIEIDRQKPSVQIQQNSTSLLIESTDDDLNTRSWSYFKSDQDPDCDDDDTFTELDYSSSWLSFDLTAVDSGKYFCFRVADKVGNETFVKTRINQLDSRAPIIRFSRQQNRVLSASANNVDEDSWQYTRSRNDLNCSDKGSLSFNQASADNSRLVLSAADSGYWYCFLVQGDNGVDGYAKILVDAIDTSKPRVSVSQKDNTILATANERSVSWHYVILAAASSDCNADAFDDADQISQGNQVTVSAANNGSVYCFRATDEADNAGFASIKVDIDDDQADDDSNGSSSGTTTSTGQPADDQDTVQVDDETVVDPDPATDPVDTDTDTDTDTDKDDEEEDDDPGIGWLVALGAVAGAVVVAAIIIAIWAFSRAKNKDLGGSDDDIDYA